MGWSQSRAALVAGYECRDATFHDEGPLNLEQAALFLCIWAIVLGMVFAGTKSLKYSVYITLPLPYFVLVVMFFRGITLDGAAEGIAYYVKPGTRETSIPHQKLTWIARCPPPTTL